MSLLDNGPHTVTVIPRVAVKGTMGNTNYKDGVPVVIPRVSVQPLSSSERSELGISTSESYKVIGRGDWPGGALSKVRVNVGPVTGMFDQSGPARVHGMSPRTAHYNVVITARGSEAK